MATVSFYVYLHKRASDGRVFYVGKGFDKRAWKKSCRSDYWKRIEKKHGRTVEIVLDGLQEWYAFELEAQLVDFYGRENLCNLRDGGEGGISPSQETRQKMSIARKGRKDKPETLEKKRKRMLGKPLADEIKKKISATLKGRTGRKHSKETKEKLRSIFSGRVVTAETGRKISEAKKGKKGRKMSESEIKAIKERLNKKIYCSNGMVFASQTDACNFLNSIGKITKGNSALSNCANGKTSSAYGFVWSFDNSAFGKEAPNTNNEKKQVKCSNGMVFNSISEAGEWVYNSGMSKSKRTRSNISSCCLGNLGSAYGLHWQYL